MSDRSQKGEDKGKSKVRASFQDQDYTRMQAQQHVRLLTLNKNAADEKPHL